MRKAVLIIAVVTLCFSLLLPCLRGHAAGGADDVRRISKEELKALLNEPGTIIIDVRQQGNWQRSDRKIKGATREDPMREEGSWANKYPKDKNIVLYCA